MKPEKVPKDQSVRGATRVNVPPGRFRPAQVPLSFWSVRQGGSEEPRARGPRWGREPGLAAGAHLSHVLQQGHAGQLLLDGPKVVDLVSELGPVCSMVHLWGGGKARPSGTGSPGVPFCWNRMGGGDLEGVDKHPEPFFSPKI